MRKTLIAAFAVALCMPFVSQAQEQDDALQAALDDSALQMALLQCDEQSFALQPAPFFAEDGELFAEGSMPPPGFLGAPQGCPMMDQQGQRPMMGRQGFMQRPMRQGQFGQRAQAARPEGQFKQGRMALDAQMAVVAPEKFAELKKLREQEAQIVKDFSAKLKADREAFKKLIDDYKANPTDDLKAQIKAKIAERMDAVNKAREARLAEQGRKIEDAKKDKDAKVDEFFSKLTSKDAPKGGKRMGPCPKDGPCPKGGDAKPLPPPPPPADKA